MNTILDERCVLGEIIVLDVFCSLDEIFVLGISRVLYEDWFLVWFEVF